MKSDERDLLAKRLHAVRLMEDIKRERSKLTRRMAKAKADNDQVQIQTIESYRSALKTLRKEAFAIAAGPEFLKIKEPKEQDLKKAERTVAKALEDYCDVNGKALVLEIARRLCRSYGLREVVSWTFSINEVYEDNMYEWMF